VFNISCAGGSVFNGNDTIPFYVDGTLLPHGSIAEPTNTPTIFPKPDTVYNTLKSLCDPYNLGFRLVRDGDNSKVYFEVHTGDDRTAGQTTRNPVVFSPDLDNLIDQTLLKSTAQQKTVAYVFAQNGSVTVYAPGANPADSGAKRRAILVDATNVNTPAGLELTASLQAIGLRELAKYQKIYQFDGQVANSSYRYGVDYNLGDLVEELDSDGYGSQMLVTEQIFVSDNQGERSYPTLTATNAITPGSWSAVDPAEVWSNVASTVHWADE
jgi:hypothetical protein